MSVAQLLVVAGIAVLFAVLAYFIFRDDRPKRKNSGGGATMNSDNVAGKVPNDYNK